MHARRVVLSTHYSPVGVDEGGLEAATARAMRHRYTADATTISARGAPMDDGVADLPVTVDVVHG